MSNIIDVWINRQYIPVADKEKYYPENTDTHIKIQIYKICLICKIENIIYNNLHGSKTEDTSFVQVCWHNETYPQIYKNRIINPINDVNFVNAIIKDPINDGMKCSGVCRQWAPMAQANQKDNTFKCWSCRTRS